MTGGEHDDAPRTEMVPIGDSDAPAEVSDDATEAIDLPEALIAAIADPEEVPLVTAEVDSLGDQTLAQVPLASPLDALMDQGSPLDSLMDPNPTPAARPRRLTSNEPIPQPSPAERPRRVASDERPVPIPLPVSAERPIPRIISRPGQPAPAPTDDEIGPTEVKESPQAPVRAPLISAPPLAIPDLATDARVPIAPLVRAPKSPTGPAPAPPARTPPPPADDFDGEEKTNIFMPNRDGPKLPRGRLTVLEGAEPGKTWYLNRARTQLGRGADNDIVLLDINVSRQHMRIDRHAQGFRVVDLDSGNGTQLNDRRIQREELFDGDTIRLGEHLIEFATLDGARPRVKDRRQTDPNIRIEKGTQQRRVGIPRAWIIAWSIATFVAVFGTMYIVRSYKARAAQAERVEAANQALEQARTAQANRQWQAAREALLRARKYRPQGVDYDASLSAINAEIRADRALRLMKLGVQNGELTEARLAFGDIPATSVYRAEAMTLEVQLKAAEHARQVDRARAERDAGRPEVARKLLQTVLTAAPGHAEATALLASLQPPAAPPSAPGTAAPATAAPVKNPTRRAPVRKRPVRKRPRAVSKGAPKQLAAGDTAYRAGRFAEAQAAFSAAAQASEGDAKSAAQKKAVAASTLASALPAAEQADRANNSAQAVRAFEKALKADRILGGRNAGRIRKPLAGHLCREAMKAFTRRQYDRAKSLNARALQLDPNLKQARKLAEMINSRP